MSLWLSRATPVAGCAIILGALCRDAWAQRPFEVGGFLEGSGQIFFARPNPSDTSAIGTAHFQLWSRVKLNNRISWRGQADFRLDTHLDVDRHRWSDLSDRGLRRPAGSLSELYLDMKLGHVDLRVGKQPIRWGRTDGYNPTDNLVPYDYLDTFSEERIAVPALKADVYAGKARFEAAWIPFYTPTRLPLFGQRWFPRLPATAPVPPTPGSAPVESDLTYSDAGGPLPARTFKNGQWGLRWNQLLPGGEFSLSCFDGYDDISYFRASFSRLALLPRPQVLVSLHREYYRIRVAGADFASGLGPFGVRGEAAYFDQTDPDNLDHLLFVVGVDRTWGDWFAVVQYADLSVSGNPRDTAIFPDLALRSAMLWRLERTLGPSRSFEISGALRLRDGDFLIQPLYSVALANRWRLRIGGTLFVGPADSYLGQFFDSSNFFAQLRYSF